MDVWLEKLKLNKQLVKSVTEAGYLSPKEIQARTMSRIIGGQDFIAIGAEGSGKTTAYVLGVLARLKQGLDDAPRALILVPTKENVLAVIEKFELLNRNKSIKISGAYAGAALEPQMEEILDGTDIVVATPDRARAIYLKLGLNLNKIIMYIVDDADLIVKQGLQLPVVELANSIRNCQHLIFTEVFHEKLEKMIAPFMKEPAVIEVEDLGEASAETIPQVLYHVPNFRTKINLLQLLLRDEELFTKTVVFVNTRLTAEKVYQSLLYTLKKETAVFNPVSFDTTGFSDINEFVEDPQMRVLIVANESKADLSFQNIPFIINLELPEEKETFISRIVTLNPSAESETMAISFSTDIELGIVRKIEQSIGKKIEVVPLPDDLLIVNEENSKPKPVLKTQEEGRGEAFHEKKPANAKNYNYGAGRKAKMTNKKKH